MAICQKNDNILKAGKNGHFSKAFEMQNGQKMADFRAEILGVNRNRGKGKKTSSDYGLVYLYRLYNYIQWLTWE